MLLMIMDAIQRRKDALSSVFLADFVFVFLLDLGLRFTDRAPTPLFFLSLATSFPHTASSDLKFPDVLISIVG